MTEPTFDASPPMPRNRLGWGVLGAVFVFLILAQFSQYMARPVDRTEIATQQHETVLRGVVMQREAVRSLGRWLSPKGDAPGSTAITQGLEDPIAALAPKRKTDADAARYYAVMRTEAGQEVVEGDLVALAKLPTPVNRAFLKIYGSKTLDEPEARALGKAVGDDTFAGKLAAVHALEKAHVEGARDGLVSPGKAAMMFTTVLALGACVLIGLVLWPIYFTARASGKLAPLGHPSGVLSEPEADRHALRAAQILLAMVALMVVAEPLTRGWPSWASSGAYSLGLLAALLLISRTRADGLRLGLGRLGWSTKNFGRHALWGVAGAVANIPVVAVLGILGVTAFRFLPPPQHPSSVELMANPSALLILSTLFSASLIAPLVEETTFRGALLPAMSSVFKNVPAGILAASLLFAAVHPTGIPAWPALAGVGAMAAMLTYQTRSLVPAMVMHAVHNFATLMLALALGG